MYKQGLHLIRVPHASTKAMLLDLAPWPNSMLFTNSFRRMIARNGCPNKLIRDNGKNFISDKT